LQHSTAIRFRWLGPAALVAVLTLAGLAAPAAADAPTVAVVRVRPVRAQVVTGFGASGAWWPNDAAEFSPAVRDRIGRLLFDRYSGIGLSIYRYNIGGGGVGVRPGPRAPRSFLTGAGHYDWSTDPGGVAFLRQAQHHDVRRLIGFANSAPPPFTTNHADCGGSLRPARIRAYVAYLAAVAAHLRTALGVRLAAVSPMNEPTSSFAGCNQEGMSVPARRRAAVISALAAALRRQAPGTAVSADESTGSAALRSRLHRWIGPDVRTVAFHGYDFPDAPALRALLRTVRARTAAPLEMSEVCCSAGRGYGPGYTPGMRGGLWLADTIWRDLSAGGASSFSWWTALSPELGCSPSAQAGCPEAANDRGWDDGLLYYDPDFRADGNQAIYFTRRYWVLGNFSRYIRPGAVHYRIAGAPAGVHVLAFRRNTWRFVLVNDSAAPRSLGLRLLPESRGHRYGAPSAYTTTATADLAPAPAPVLDRAARTVTAALPARSVTTVIVPW